MNNFQHTTSHAEAVGIREKKKNAHDVTQTNFETENRTKIIVLLDEMKIVIIIIIAMNEVYDVLYTHWLAPTNTVQIRSLSHGFSLSPSLSRRLLLSHFISIRRCVYMVQLELMISALRERAKNKICTAKIELKTKKKICVRADTTHR